MTTKEIAEIAGVSVQTVRRTAESRVGFVFVAGKKADFTEKESIEIMRELKKKGFIQPVQNGQVPVQNGQVPVQNGQVEQLGVMVANLSIMMQESMKMMVSQQNQITAILSQKTQLSIETKQTPKLSPRDELRMIVNKAAKESGDYSGAWKTLYTEIYYRLHINAQERAKNAKATAIEILDSEGQLENAVAIAREIFK